MFTGLRKWTETVDDLSIRCSESKTEGGYGVLALDEAERLATVRGALALRPDVEDAVDSISRDGFDNLVYLGIGGTYASGLQAVSHITAFSGLPTEVQNAGEYIFSGNRRITNGSVVVISSVTGTTPEVVQAVSQAKTAGARVIGFIDDASSPLAGMVDVCFSVSGGEQIKFFMVGDRLMHLRGEFEDYEPFYAEMDEHLASALLRTEQQADAFGADFARWHYNDSLHYFVAAGNQFGAVYSYAMCYWEEQHWLRSRAIHAAEFFHGMLEIVDRDTNVTIFLGEDEQRPLAQRVADFLPRICANYTIVDTKDYPLEGISPRFRGLISHLVMRVITYRMDAHIEALSCHPMEIRRYYRRLDY